MTFNRPFTNVCPRCRCHYLGKKVNTVYDSTGKKVLFVFHLPGETDSQFEDKMKAILGILNGKDDSHAND